MTPLSNAFISPGQAQAEKSYELHAYVCGTCRLVQLGQFETPQQIFGNYPYFSSYSETWLRHAERYTAAMMGRFGLGPSTQLVEIASNDGYLLQYFQTRGVPVLGIEPAANVAEVARAKGIPTDIAFFGAATAERLRAEGVAPALIAANNVLAHVPDINDFVRGLAMLLAPDGVITPEFPHLLRLIEQIQFDTIYHEHFSYFSLLSAERILAHHGIDIFDVEELSTHGGSLRLYAGHRNAQPILPSVGALRTREREGGLDCATPYAGFAARVAAVRQAIRQFFADAQRDGRRVAGYGAPAKGNTLLNHCGIGAAQMPFTVDRSPHKQGLLLPGAHIPILAPDAVFQSQPDFLFILPWNLSEEIMRQMAAIHAWGGRFVVPIPQLVVL
jgi:SAM-dependent methyltransferase